MVVDTELLAILEASAKQESKKGRSNKKVQTALGHPDLKLTRWKFSEFDYYRDCLPCFARGLFTHGDRIVLRGYDKFFNCGERASTEWGNLVKETEGPYQVTVKENGCLLLIAGFEGRLLVTSKNSTGEALPDMDKEAHAEVGRCWLAKQLEKVGKTERELADELERLDVTAVGEFCDDSFEEHVFAYGPKDAGIYLHGLNCNTAEFATLESAKVNELGAQFGFARVDYLVYDTIAETRNFLESCAKSGSWNDRDIEGFVIRCKKKDKDTSASKDFFFKYKFEEPYLLFRSWREALRKSLSGNTKIAEKHAKSSAQFVVFANKYLTTHPELLAKIKNTGNGIIELREKFIESRSLSITDLMSLSLNANDDDANDREINGGLPVCYCFVPISVLGAGKTTLGVALNKLVGLPHVQNDEVSSHKNKKSRFIELCANTICTAPESAKGVFIDRNNPRTQERQQIFDSMRSAMTPRCYEPVFICLDFMPEGVTENQQAICRRRVTTRGNNHSTLHGMTSGQKIGIVSKFEKQFRPFDGSKLPDNQFDLRIKIDIAAPVDKSLVRIVTAVNDRYKLSWSLDSAKIEEAVAAALAHKAKIPKMVASEPKAKQKLGFIGVKITEDIYSLVDRAFGENAPLIWQKVQSGEYKKKTEYHVTLAHVSSHKLEFQKLVDEFAEPLAAAAGQSGQIIELPATDTVKVVSLGYSDQVVALKVELEKYKCANAVPHITVALKTGVRAVESGLSFAAQRLEELPLSAEFKDQRLFAHR